MNNVDKLNEVIKYIENNLTNTISMKYICQILCVNEYSAYRIFDFIAGVSLTEYIRNRRLSMAGLDLINSNIKIIDLAIKYGYDSPISFSRAFTIFHGVKPSKVRENKAYLKNFPPLTFSNEMSNVHKLDFKIEKETKIELYSIYKHCSVSDIKIIAPQFWTEVESNPKYVNIFDTMNYGIIEYDELFPTPKSAKYHIASLSPFYNSSKITIPESTWAKFRIIDINGDSMSKLGFYVYKNWIPYSGYNIRNIPEIEVYYQDSTEWWLPIEENK